MSDTKGAARQQSRETLLPGIALPVIGYLGSAVAGVLAIILVIHPGPEHSLAARWGGGQLVILGIWALYKLASNRIILGEDVMRIVSWGRIWTVCRGEVESVLLTDEIFSLSIILTDGTIIRPGMFVASPLGIGYFRAGLFRNAMSRETIAARITEWNEQAHGVSRGEKPGRRWSVRLDLPFLLIASAVIAAEAIALTEANVW